MRQPAPLFTHDCECCKFLGVAWDANREQFADLYACKDGGIAGMTVIARFGDDGPQYTSMPMRFTHGAADPILKAAAALADTE